MKSAGTSWIFVVCIGFLLLAVSAAAQRDQTTNPGTIVNGMITGNKLFDYCKESRHVEDLPPPPPQMIIGGAPPLPKEIITNTPPSGICFGYLDGIADAMANGDSVWGYRVCVPAGVTTAQLRDVAVQFLQSHPATRHVLAGQLMAMAFSEAFPCH
jgi:hypothetical protein